MKLCTHFAWFSNGFIYIPCDTYFYPLLYIFYTHLQTLAIAIQASKLLEPSQGIFVLSAVGRPELSQSVFQAGKKTSVNLSWSSQHSLLAQTQSCGKCRPVAFILPSEQRKQSFTKQSSVPKYLLCSLPNVTLIQGETLLQGFGITIIHMQSPAITTLKVHEKWWQNTFE